MLIFHSKNKMWLIHTNPETTNPPRKTSQSQSWALKNTTTNMQHQSKIIATVAGSFKVARLQNRSSSSQVCNTWPGSRGWGWASLCGSGKWAGQSELYTSEGATPSEAGACREANVNWLVFARVAHFACGGGCRTVTSSDAVWVWSVWKFGVVGWICAKNHAVYQKIIRVEAQWPKRSLQIYLQRAENELLKALKCLLPKFSPRYLQVTFEKAEPNRQKKCYWSELPFI